MKTPPFLKKGDQVAIVCTASFIRGTIDEAISVLQSWGLKVLVGDTVGRAYHQFGGTDEARTKDLQSALDNPEIKAIFAARGGYGTVRIIDQIDFSGFEKNPKWMIGFSDITVLHSHIQRQFGIQTIHGQMPKTFEGGTKTSLDTLKKALFGNPYNITYSQKQFPNRTGIAEGILAGGNLAILHSLIGSSSDIEYDNKILFIEDVGEAHYNIDRMLWTLKRAEKLNRINGLIVGGFTSLKDSEPPFGESFEEIIMDKVKEFDFPVTFGFPAGHIDDNHALILGKKVKLSSEKYKVTFTYIN